jgi:Putative polyhydroxyalkanoic acid system protein (PHA_gran_rgn)
MNAPLVVEIPHRLGKEEAIRRLKGGLGRASAQYGKVLQVHEEIWSGDRLSFRVEALRQMASGTVDVRDENVRIEVTLPWLLARLANGIQAAIRKSGTLMLEKKP